MLERRRKNDISAWESDRPAGMLGFCPAACSLSAVASNHVETRLAIYPHDIADILSKGAS
jgi:hypothetical protein